MILDDTHYLMVLTTNTHYSPPLSTTGVCMYTPYLRTYWEIFILHLEIGIEIKSGQTGIVNRCNTGELRIAFRIAQLILRLYRSGKIFKLNLIIHCHQLRSLLSNNLIRYEMCGIANTRALFTLRVAFFKLRFLEVKQHIKFQNRPHF